MDGRPSQSASAALAAALASAKLSPPRTLECDEIDRTRLHDHFKLASQTLVTSIIAPAGYGKTTILRRWYDRARDAGLETAWFSLDETDDDPVTFTRYLVRAISQASPQISDKLRNVVDIGLDLNTRATAVAITNALETLSAPVMVFVDDFHFVKADDTLEIISAIINAGTRQLRLVLASRARLPLKLAKLRTTGSLLEVRANDLQFSEAEARAFIAHECPRFNDPVLIDRVIHKTEGWPTGLKLAVLAIRDNPEIAEHHLLSGSERRLSAYVHEEVISSLPPRLATFVSETALLGEFSAALANQVLDLSDSAKLLDEARKRQVFLFPLTEPGWYRYHSIISDASSEEIAQRAPERKSEIHLKAAAWLDRNGLLERALHQLQMADRPDKMAELLDRRAEDLLQSGNGATLLRYSRLLPETLVFACPGLQLERAYAATLAWQFSTAQHILRAVAASLAKQSTDLVADDLVGTKSLAENQRILIHRRLQLDILMDDMPNALRHGQAWQSAIGDVSPFDDAVTRTSIIYAKRELLDCASVGEATIAREIFETHGRRWATVWHDSIIGACYIQMGELDRAETIFRQALATATRVVSRISPTAAMPALHLAEVLFERNACAESRDLVDAYLPLATETGVVDQLVSGFLIKARLAAEVSVDESLSILSEGEKIGYVRGFDRLIAFINAERARLLSANGGAAVLRKLAAKNGWQSDIDHLKPRTGMTTADAANAYAAGHVAIVDNRLGEAETLLHRWSTFLDERGFATYAIRMLLALAHVQILQGETTAAQRTIMRSVQLAARGGHLRSFANANPAVRSAIAMMEISASSPNAWAAPHLAAIRPLVGAVPAMGSVSSCAEDEPDAPHDALNDREHEILLMISGGLMNKQIASELGLTLGTVKWYLQQIYGKLGVNSRSKAVFRARQVGLLS